MTAHMVVLAQTKIGFLSGGRGQTFRELPHDEQLIQIEEAYARATVAFTRARTMRVIFGHPAYHSNDATGKWFPAALSKVCIWVCPRWL